MRLLRERCPWKAEQTHRSLERYLLEEAHEVIEAIDASDPEHLREELGDLLLQVYFHAVIAEEAGQFTLDDVARGIADKMRRRNPHVFGSERAGTAAEVNDRWQEIKATEGRRASILDGLPPTLPALLLAEKVLDRLDRAGVPGVEGDPSTVERDPSTVKGDPSAIGERLWAVVEDARDAGVDPEQALRDVVRRRAGHPAE